MVALPQRGHCLCGEIEYRLDEEPVTLYACHCTDCQRHTGASFALSLIVRQEALRIVRGRPREYGFGTGDGRHKQASYCPRCITRLWGPSTVPGLAVLGPGTLDDTSWLDPVGHIWTRSKQPWVPIPEDALRFERQPDGEEWLAFVRAWKGRLAPAD